MKLLEPIQAYVESLSSIELSDERRVILDEMVSYIQSSSNPKLNFICTHNSRRSHLSQIWAQAMGYFFEVELETFSGGTEATAFNPNAVATLERAGFQIKNPGGANPRYQVSFSEDAQALESYSKKFDAPENPSSGFAALMTCSEADAECPIVFGASARIKLFYDDPKIADGTPEESATYDERCKQIATEMYYVFQKVAKS